MEEQKKSRAWRKDLLATIVMAAVSITIAILSLVVYSAVKPKPAQGAKTVSVQILYQNKTFSYVDLHTDSLYLKDLLQEFDKAKDLKLVVENGSYGAYIVSLKGVAQDSQKGYYYTFTVNGQFGEYGIDAQPVHDGDAFVFSYAGWDGTNSILAPYPL